MQHPETVVVGGVDARADAHHAAALDQRGALLGTESFPTRRAAIANCLTARGKLREVNALGELGDPRVLAQLQLARSGLPRDTGVLEHKGPVVTTSVIEE